MKLAQYRHPNGTTGVGVIHDFTLTPLNFSGGQYNCLADVLEADNPAEMADFLADPSGRISLGKITLLPPIDQQEVWAAGLTYRSTHAARQAEPRIADTCYDQVYRSPRPELFLKATPHRVIGPDQAVRIRHDSQWTVPEPELTVVLNSHLQLVGFTIGNDMSARDIASENPLYLPQAKTYDACCSLGPCITLPVSMPPEEDVNIQMRVLRGHGVAFEGSTSVGQMARSFDNLISWLGRECSFPHGVFLLTGTGIVPPPEFTLQNHDAVEIMISGIGTLTNPVIQG
ncbi:MAG: fumarylacetoacetate hydrolase family protein [Planctomycetota bacterium]